MTTATIKSLRICRACGVRMPELRLCWFCLKPTCQACDVANRCLCAKEREREVN